MRESYLSIERIYLRAVEPEDLEIMYAIENDPEMWDISNFVSPYSRYMLKQYIEASQSDVFADKQLRLMIVGHSDNEIIGTLDLTDFVPLHSRAEVGIAVRREFRGKGYATDALTLLCDYCFRFLRMHQLYARMAADNAECIALFRSAGFSQTAVLKDWLISKDGCSDVLLFQKIQPKG
jgi:diamine N-acetyltransferase